MARAQGDGEWRSLYVGVFGRTLLQVLGRRRGRRAGRIHRARRRLTRPRPLVARLDRPLAERHLGRWRHTTTCLDARCLRRLAAVGSLGQLLNELAGSLDACGALMPAPLSADPLSRRGCRRRRHNHRHARSLASRRRVAARLRGRIVPSDGWRGAAGEGADRGEDEDVVHAAHLEAYSGANNGSQYGTVSNRPEQPTAVSGNRGDEEDVLSAHRVDRRAHV